MSLDEEILGGKILGLFGYNERSILVEGLQNEVYPKVIAHIRPIIKKWEGISIDFLEMLKENKPKMPDRLKKFRTLFIYNMDLFGGDIDPDEATRCMCIMRAVRNSRDDHRQLLIARPNANLDYNSRKGYIEIIILWVIGARSIGLKTENYFINIHQLSMDKYV